MIALLLLAVFYLYVEQQSIKISAVQLAFEYEKNKTASDKNYLNKEITITGKAKAYYEFGNESNLLELNSGQAEIGVYCIIVNPADETFAQNLTRGTKVKTMGNCIGILDRKFPNSIYIEVSSIK
jgi:hypothetical protein